MVQSWRGYPKSQTYCGNGHMHFFFPLVALILKLSIFMQCLDFWLFLKNQQLIILHSHSFEVCVYNWTVYKGHEPLGLLSGHLGLPFQPYDSVWPVSVTIISEPFLSCWLWPLLFCRWRMNHKAEIVSASDCPDGYHMSCRNKHRQPLKRLCLYCQLGMSGVIQGLCWFCILFVNVT